MLGKLKTRYVGRGSLNFMKHSEIKNKYRSPSSVDSKSPLNNLHELGEPKKSRFAT